MRMKKQAFHKGISLSSTLGILPGLTAVVGSGGKTTLMLRLAQELCRQGSVIITTSTHIYPPEGIPLVTGGRDEIEAALSEHALVCAGTFAETGKLSAPVLAFHELAQLANYVLVEADGSRRLPLKAHAAHEPNIPGGARVIAVVGASGFNKPIGEAAHRPELYARALGADINALVTPEMAAQAAKAHFPGGTIVLNQVDDGETLHLAARFAQSYGGGTVIAAALREPHAVKAIWRE